MWAVAAGLRRARPGTQESDRGAGDRGPLAAAVETGMLEPRDGLLFRDAQELFLSVILEQQLLDIDRGLAAGNQGRDPPPQSRSSANGCARR